ncbi:hypothetical protein Misp01_69660 [Microtetraspora sp. NBRC 13810]|nr:hypothetical protein Misp01_69660 [Microtetraspora sp. NBRC 13810]
MPACALGSLHSESPATSAAAAGPLVNTVAVIIDVMVVRRARQVYTSILFIRSRASGVPAPVSARARYRPTPVARAWRARMAWPVL